jgi:predicted nucleotidyltransferase
MEEQLKAGTSEEIESSVVAIIRRHMSAGMRYKVFLFGSRATGCETERSDHDVGIEAEGNIPFGVLSEIRLEVDELPTLRKVDVVDFARVSAAFKAVAKEQTKALYAG